MNILKWHLVGSLLIAGAAFGTDGDLHYDCRGEQGSHLKVVMGLNSSTAEIYQKKDRGSNYYLIYEAAQVVQTPSLKVIGVDVNKPAGTCNVAMKPTYQITIDEQSDGTLSGYLIRLPNVFNDPRALCPSLAVVQQADPAERLSCDLP